MRKKTKTPGSNDQPAKPKRLSNAVATTAVSLTLLTSAQDSLQAQQPQNNQSGGSSLFKPKKPAAPQPSNDAAYQKYFANGYNYADAKLLAAYWGEKSVASAKLRLGNKMLAFGPADGKAHILTARAELLKKDLEKMPVSYTDGGYTFKDAVLLGKYWGTSEPYEAKLKMGLLLALGNDAVIKTALKEAKSNR